jgi:hypothetical protein
MLAAVSLGVSKEEAFPVITEYMQRAGRSPECGELERQWPNAETRVAKASGTTSETKSSSQKTVPYDGDFLRAFVRPIEGVPDIELYLKERSPLPVDISAAEFLSTVFPLPEKSVFFNVMQSPGWLHPYDQNPPDLINYFVPDVPEGHDILRNENGMWYLCQPVDGVERINGSGRTSIRSEENVVSFKHIVIESDVGKQDPEQPELWLRSICLLRLPIVSIITSGNPRSGAHILVKVNAANKEAWTERKDQIKFGPLLGRLGANPAVYSAVRLTRLANVPRPDKGGFQTLLYLNPNPTGKPIYQF